MIVASPANPAIKKLRALMERSRVREKEGAYVIEGRRMFSEAPEDLLREVFISESYSKKYPIPKTESLYIVSDALFKKTADTSTPQGIMAVVEKPACELADVINGNSLILLEGVQDPGNLGTIVRTAEAAGIFGVIMDEGCADIFSPKVVRSTMGSIFRLPFIRVPSIKELVPDIKGAGFKIYASHLKGSVPVNEISFSGKTGIIIGSEGSGISDALTDMADAAVRIPMEGRVESLNAAVSAAILMYKFKFDQCS